MFESTLEAQALDEGTGRFGTLSAAALAHLGIGVAIVVVTAIVVPPVKVPEPPLTPITIVRGILLERTAPARAPAVKKGTEAPTARRAVAPRPPESKAPPVSTPDTLPTNAPGTDGPVGDPSGDPDGRDVGVPGGPDVGDVGSGEDRDLNPVEVTPDMSRPVLLVKVEPAYPEVARRARLGGRVTVRAVIGIDGAIESAEVFASTNPLFDEAAVSAVRRWRYRPAVMNGTPVRVYFSVVVDFVVR